MASICSCVSNIVLSTPADKKLKCWFFQGIHNYEVFVACQNSKNCKHDLLLMFILFIMILCYKSVLSVRYWWLS